VFIPYKDLPGVFLPLCFLGSASDYLMAGKHGSKETDSVMFELLCSGIALTLDKSMTSNLMGVMEIVTSAKSDNYQQSKAWARLATNATGPYLNSSLMRQVEAAVTGKKWGTKGEIKEAFIGAIPFGNTLFDRPAKENMLGKEVTTNAGEILVSRFFSSPKLDPVITPLVKSGLTIPNPTHEGIVDLDNAYAGKRPLTYEERSVYETAFKKEMVKQLTPKQVSTLTDGISGSIYDTSARTLVARNTAQKVLTSLGTKAKAVANKVLEKEMGVTKAKRDQEVKNALKELKDQKKAKKP